MNRMTRKSSRLFAGLFALCCLAMATPAKAVLIAYWDFNDSPGTSGPADLIVDQGAGTLTTDFFDPPTNVTHFTGTGIGALPGSPPVNRDLALIAGGSLVNNTKSIVFAINTTGKTNIVLSYATRRSDQGFNSVQIAYSTNGGGSYTNFGAPYDPPTAYQLKIVDFGNALDNNANVRVKITFDGATNSTGNNRLDNVQLFSGGIPTGACCYDAGANCQVTTEDNCLNTLLGVYLGDSSTCTTCPSYSGIVLNEIRVDQSGSDTDEYIEIFGPAGASLTGLSVVVIGDDADGTTGEPPQIHSGFVENIIKLSGTIPANGHFLIASDNNTLDSLPSASSPHVAANLLTTFSLENSDNTTFFLVSGFRGTGGQDLDLDNDCVLDANPPWVQEYDRVAIVDTDPPAGPTDDCQYGDFGAMPPTAVGPELVGVTLFAPGHIYRYDPMAAPVDGPGRPWLISDFNPALASDSPGAVNGPSMGACCRAGVCTTETRANCEQPPMGPAGTWKGRDLACTPNPCVGGCCTNDVCAITFLENCQGAGQAYQGDGTTCPPGNVCIPCTDINTARQAVLAATPPAYPNLKVCNGVVTNITDLVSSTNSKSFHIQDTSGPGGQTGITVFGGNTLITTALSGVSLGDSIDIQGFSTIFSGLVEMQNGTGSNLPLVRFANHGNVGVPAAKHIACADLIDASPTAEDLESEYVQVDCVAFAAGNGTNLFQGFNATTNPSGGNYVVTDGINLMSVRIATSSLDWEGSVIPTGLVNLRGIVTQFDQSAAPVDAGYQILLRGRGILPATFPDDLDDPPVPACSATTGACCFIGSGGPYCRANLPQAHCVLLGGAYQGNGTSCGLINCPSVDGVVINEIRVDEPTAGDPNEYFELKGPPGVPLGSLTYLVIGDGAAACGSGVVEAAIPLTFQAMPASGFFLAANTATYTLGGTVNLNTTLNFEDDDNVTHMLVENYVAPTPSACSTGSPIDLDVNDDGILDSTPWTRVLSQIALVKSTTNPPTGTEWYYGPVVGPTPGGFSPGHVIRCPGAINDYIIGTFDIPANGGNDTPGAVNNCVGACLSCPGDVDGSLNVDLSDLSGFVLALLDIAPNPCADTNIDGKVDGADVRNMIALLTASATGTSCIPPNQRNIVRCDNASPPNDCPAGNFTWCVYQVDTAQAGVSPCIVVGPGGANSIGEGETFCVKCPASLTCGTLNSKTVFHWENYDGNGNDCTFIATLTTTNCGSCAGFNKRFGDPPAPPELTIMDWNLLNYGSGRVADFQTVLNAVQPDLLVTQEIDGNNSGASNFLNSVLNGAGGPLGYSLATFTNGPDTDQALFYKTTKFSIIGHTSIVPVPTIRWIDRWQLSITGLASPANDLYIYSMHLKASDTPADAAQRAVEATAVRNDANALPAGSNIIYAGDMNLYTSAESAYAQFTGSQGDNDGQCFDPINRPGTWHANATFAGIHTQSPHNNNAGAPSGATPGGLDDRFDFMLISAALNDGSGLTYKPGSYKAYGQDGNHYNNDINDPPTIPEGSAIANALHAASDHLPVVMKLLTP